MPSFSAYPTGSWVLKPGGTLFWSPEMYRICDFDPKQGQPSYLDLMARIHPDDSPQVDRTVQSSFVLHTRMEGECRLMARGGTIKHLRFVGHPVATPDGAMEFVGIVVDETEQRSSAESTPASVASPASEPGPAKYARLLPQHYHSYPPDYRRQWFPVLDRNPDTSVVAQPGYIWVQTPWRLHAMWAEHFEIEESELRPRS